jgi:hypothetical protein
VTAQKAREGKVHLGWLPIGTQRRLKQQLLAPEWELNGIGQRVVEEKKVTKAKIGRSPDLADSLNLCFYNVVASVPTVLHLPERQRPQPWSVSHRR